MRARPALFIAVCLLSCQHAPPQEPSPPDFHAAQQRAWSLVPEDAGGGLVVARFGGLLDELRGLRELVSAGPVVRRHVEAWTNAAKERLGFDPLDGAEWRALGVDLEAPAGFFLDARFDKTGIFVGVVSGTSGQADLTPLEALFTGKLGVPRCHLESSWALCGDEGVQFAPDAAHSLWSRVAREAAGVASSGLLAYARLDLPSTASVLSGTEFTAASQSVALGLTAAPHEVRAQLRYANPKSGEARPYLALDPTAPSVLGVATGATGVSRLAFSPQALWSLAERRLSPDVMRMASGGLQAATGLDLKTDIVDNFTGEVVFAFAPEHGFGAEFFGARDEAKTAKLLERIDGLIAGAMSAGRAQDMAALGLKFSHSVDTVRGHKVYGYKYEVTQAGLPTMPVEMHVTSGPGALVMAFDREGCAWALSQLGKPAKRFQDTLEPPLRSLFGVAAPPFAGWGTWYNVSRLLDRPEWKEIEHLYAGISPELPAVWRELLPLAQLVWDSYYRLDVEDQAIALDLHSRLL